MKNRVSNASPESSTGQYLVPAAVLVGVIGSLVALVWPHFEPEPEVDPDVARYTISYNPVTEERSPIYLSGRLSPSKNLDGRFSSSYEDTGNKQAEAFFDDGQEVGKWSIWDESGQLRRQFEFGEDGGCDETQKELFVHKHCGEGLQTDWHANGQKAGEGMIIGLIVGPNPPWRPQDGLQREPVGRWTEWFENGQQKSEIVYAGAEQHLDGGKTRSKWAEHREFVDSTRSIIKIDEWFESGQKKLEASYIDGQKDGEYNEWFESGQSRLKESYVDGQKDGAFAEWFENGQKKLEASYIDGQKDGAYNEWFDSGQKKIEQNWVNNNVVGEANGWYESGQKKFEKGATDEYRMWHENGSVSSENVRETNTVNGSSYQFRQTSYNEYGQKATEYFRGNDNDPKKYIYTHWRGDGRMLYQREHTDGSQTYKFTQWHDSGQVSLQQNFVNGVKEGLSIGWHENGQKSFEEVFKRGMVVSRTSWDESGVQQ